MRITIYRGTDETAPWETREVRFDCFDRGKAVLWWDGLNGTLVFWLNAGKGHIGGHGVDAPSWFMRTADLAALKAKREADKRAAKKAKAVAA